jgi:hypothetical protein
MIIVQLLVKLGFGFFNAHILSNLPRNHGVNGFLELVLNLMQIRVANSTVENVESDILRSSWSAYKTKQTNKQRYAIKAPRL